MTFEELFYRIKTDAGHYNETSEYPVHLQSKSM